MTVEELKESAEQFEFLREIVFGYYLPQDDPVHQDVLKNCNAFADISEYLKENHGENYKHFGGMTISSKGLERVSIIKRNVEGARYRANYKGLEFWFDAENEKILRGICRFETGIGSKDGSFELLYQDNLEKYYQEAIHIIKRNKRKIMNYYNKLIKDIKQEYKEELKRHNDILKGDSK